MKKGPMKTKMMNHLLSRMDANVRTGVKTSEEEAGAGGQDQVEELLVYA